MRVMEQKEKIMFIINPASGARKRKKIEKIIQKTLDLEVYDFTFRYVQGPGQAFEMARDAVSQGYKTVVAVGGDGSVNLVAKALMGSGVKIGIIPTGSGNGLARYLSIPLNPGNAVKILNNRRFKLIDTATVNGEFFVSIAGVGFDARVADQFARQLKRGFFTYFKVSLREFLRYRPKRFKIIVDDDIYNLEAFFISLANSNQFGYNTAIAPQASIDDGLLDVCIVGKPPLIKIPFVAYMLFTGRFNRIRYVRSFKARNLKLIQKDSGIVNLDGDPVDIGKELNISVNPLSLTVVIP